MENPNPVIYKPSWSDEDEDEFGINFDDSIRDPITKKEIYNLVRHINDPEHPLTLEQLNVVQQENISIEPFLSHTKKQLITLMFTPTIPHCSMATLIGLCLKVRLERCLPSRQYHILVRVQPGSHQAELDINKQLDDKERVAAALENEHLINVVNACLSGPPRIGIAL